MRLFIAITLFILFLSCSKASKQYQVNFQIKADSTSKGLYYKPFLNGILADSFNLDINGQSRFWFGWEDEGSNYTVELLKQSKYDTGWVNVVWYNGVNDVLKIDKVRFDTISASYQNVLIK